MGFGELFRGTLVARHAPAVAPTTIERVVFVIEDKDGAVIHTLRAVGVHSTGAHVHLDNLQVQQCLYDDCSSRFEHLRARHMKEKLDKSCTSFSQLLQLFSVCKKIEDKVQKK